MTEPGIVVSAEQWIFFGQVIVLVGIWVKYRDQKKGMVPVPVTQDNRKCPYHDLMVKGTEDERRRFDDSLSDHDKRFHTVDDSLKDLHIKVGILMGQLTDVKSAVGNNQTMVMSEINGVKVEVREAILQAFRAIRSEHA